MTRRDTRTPDLFEVPHPASAVPGAMDFRPLITAMVGQMLDAAARLGKDRFQVAAEVSRLVGREVSKYMLDAYTAPSREDYNAPAWLIAPLEVVSETWIYSRWLAEVRGGRLLIGRDALAAELGRIERQKDELHRAERAIKEQLRHG